jgi:hypothetical protein
MVKINKKKLSLTTAVLIDNTVKFDAIETGLTSVADMETKDQRDKIASWNEPLRELGETLPKNKDDLTYYAKNHIKIAKMIRDKYTNENTINLHLSVLYHVLLSVDKVKYKQQARNYILDTKARRVIIEKASKSQVLTKSEIKNFECFDVIERKRDELFMLWMKKPEKVSLNMQHLILALYTYLPPVRDNYREMELITSRSKAKPGLNYLLKIKGKYRVIIDNDKVAGHFETDDFDMPTNAYADGEAMTAILDRSFLEYPRKYLLTEVAKDTPMSYQSLIGYMRKVFNGKHVYINVLRKSFINHFYDQSFNFVYGEKEDIAKRMRHGSDVTERDYNKPMLKKMCIDEEQYEPEIDVVKIAREESDDDVLLPLKHRRRHRKISNNTTGTHIPAERGTSRTITIYDKKQTKEHEEDAEALATADKPKYNPVVRGKEYRQENREDINRKAKIHYEKNKKAIQRNKLIKNLNNGFVVKTKTATAKKYGLKYNKQTGEYY